jgi:two-component system response regulator AtoC
MMLTKARVPLAWGEAPSSAEGELFFVESISPAMQTLERVVADIAPTDIPVLLVGESGTGKEIMARRIHQLSRRSHEGFLKLSCAALASESLGELVEAERNGYGRQQSVTAGTVFLDEICELDGACQPWLLRALPDGSEAGANGALLAARLICSTSRNLEEEMRGGRFREELYFRINGVCLRLPPLRHRREDLPLLVGHFQRKYEAQFGRARRKLSPRLLELMAQHSWPGNIRELENAVKKVVALGDEQVAVEDLEGALAGQRSNGGHNGTLSLKEAARAASRQAERELILKALTRTRWNRKRAAQELQISYKALLYKLKQIGMDEPGVS